MPYSDGDTWGWCKRCEQMQQSEADDALECPECGARLVPSKEMNEAQREAAKFIEWNHELVRKGLWGQSPGGAAGELNCSRAHIDMLVAAGVLERSEYDLKPGKIIMISQRSIEKAKRNKKETGSWNPRGRGNE